ncbi:hypothetical protein RHSIM_Rhsim12G0198400 [Rhododendron simsii]|uniref:OVATE domain-containing protein n=1 Tax=Rhododendron simsii TaxID=118357 RepID=A0A834G555_RHOSS|nr:hypothetical protein RHSIM_Rhsim12G0198400 [Rhododendron simsii]
MDAGSWCNSGHSTHTGYSRTFFLGNYSTRFVPFDLPVSSGSKAPIWRLLWRKIKKGKKKLFNIYSSSTNHNFTYSPCTYAQNFDEGSMWENLDDLSRSFSARILSSSSKRKILRACKHPKTRSIAVGDVAATLADIDKFMFENFNSLYLEDDKEDDKKQKIQENDRGLSSPDDEEKAGTILLESPRFTDPPPDLCGSHRFFVGSSSSSSLITKSSTIASDDKGSSSATTAVRKMGADDFITILKYSPSPYSDFRNSMEEMAEARLNDRGRVDWEFMEELLFCYLDLNEKKWYKYILSAFVDLIVVLREKSGRVSEKSRRGPSVRDRRKPISSAENLVLCAAKKNFCTKMSVVGFDLGNESCVVAVARQRGIDVVLNDESKGETPAIVCFGETQHFLETTEAASSMMNPENTISQIKRLIGRQFSDPELQRDLKALPFAGTEGPDGFPLIHVCCLGESRTFTPTQLLAMVLSDMKSMAEKNLNAAVVDCCIGIPVYFTDLQRRAVLDAANIAGLHPLRLLHETTAIALAYGIYKTDLPENDQLNVAFVDIGHASMQVCIAGFKKGQLKILAHSFNRSLGGRDFDEALFQYFAAKFKEKYKIDVYQNARACLRLRIACEKLVLGANPEAPLKLVSLMEEKDVKGFIKRENFEKISIPILGRMRKPLEKALSEAGLTVENIHAVEVVGSGSRVPAIIRILTEFFRKEPRRIMNSSECVAKGCALECAFLSSTFEVQKFQVNESLPFPVAFSWNGAASDAQNGVADNQQSTIVFPKGNPIPSIKALTFYRSGTFTVDVQYADVSELQATAKISSYTIGPFQSTESELVKVKVKVHINLHGIVSIDSATLLQTYEVEKVEVPVFKEPAKEANKTKKTNIPVVDHIYGGMCPADVQKAKEEEFEMAVKDRVMEETKDKKNAVEASVYDMRNKIQRGKSLLLNSRRWKIGCEDGENEIKDVYVAKRPKLEELTKQGDPIEEHYKKYTENDNFLEGQEGVDAVTVKRVIESHAPSVEPCHLWEGIDKRYLVPLISEVPRRGLPCNWREDDYLVSRYPDGSAGMRLGAQEEIRLSPQTLFAEVREEHKAILSNIFELWPSTFVRLIGASSISRKLALDSLVSFVEALENMSLPQATPGDFDSARDGLQALTHFQLEVDWLRKRLDRMASLLELSVARDQLEKVGKEIEEMEEVVRGLKDKKEGFVQRVSELESASSGGFDMSSHAGQGLRG